MYLDTVMILSFWTDRSWQTMQPEQSSLLRVYTVCNSVCIFWMHYSMVKPLCLNFMVITANIWVSEYLGILQYVLFQPADPPPVAKPDDEEEEEVPLFNPNASKELPQATDQTTEVLDTALKDLTPR